MKKVQSIATAVALAAFSFVIAKLPFELPQSESVEEVEVHKTRSMVVESNRFAFRHELRSAKV